MDVGYVLWADSGQTAGIPREIGKSLSTDTANEKEKRNSDHFIPNCPENG